MTHAFSDILRRRAQRRLRIARAGYLLKRSSKWLVAIGLSALFVCVLAGFAEARADVNSSFDWPWTWLKRLGGGDRPIVPLTGALLVLFTGSWLTLAGIALLRVVLRIGFGPLAIAGSVVHEAVRNKVVVVLLALLLIALAQNPFSTASAALRVDQPLRYQIQTFLSFSGIITAVLLGVVAILFSAYSVSQDINVRRTGDVFVKPIRRVVYLLGKWLGVVSLLAVVLAVETLLVWGVCRLWLGSNQALDAQDLAAINQHVLVARGETLPQPPEPFRVAALQRLRQLERDQPDMVAQRGAAELLNDLEFEERNQFMRIPYGTRKEYLFTGLRDAKRNAVELEKTIAANAEMLAERMTELMGMPVTPEQISLAFVTPWAGSLGIDIQPALVQWRFQISGTNTYASATGTIDLSINGQPLRTPVSYIIDRVQVRDLPATYIDDDGTLLLEIANIYPDSLGRQRPIQFNTSTWMQVYHVKGDFAPNLVRGALIHLVRIAFLAMLGVVAGSLWSFPVAATVSVSVWLLAAGGSWLQQTLTYRVADTHLMPVDVAFNDTLLPLIGWVASFLSIYSSVPVTANLADGRYISWAMVTSQTFQVGIIWMGVVLAVGGYLFTRRELARVQV